MAMGVAGIGPTLWEKRTPTLSHKQSTSLQHRGQYRIIQEQQLVFVKLQCHMAIAEVISGCKQVQGCGRLYLQ